MRRKRRIGAIGFSNEKFLSLLAATTGISPVGVLGRETPLDLSSLEAARGSLLLKEVFSKYDDGTPSPEKEALTWKRFHDAERSCLLTNQRVALWDWPDNVDPYWVCVRARIREVLGPFNWDSCAQHFSFGPGATTRLTRVESYAAYKYSGIPESTLGNAVLATCAIRMLPIWNQIVLSRGADPHNLCKIVEGNSIIAVPKNYKTDRTIAKEPCMNIYIQKGLGATIRSRLHRVGVRLNDQSLNQRAALEGSLTGRLATVDLSMASDTVSAEVVRWLLPYPWLEALEQCRSPSGVLPSGELLNYQKFSSMGNGYTFELESLIFWAMAQEVCRPFKCEETDPSICVYGDDIVIPTQFYETFCQRLGEAGFTPNPTKSWAEGPYRESCGKHYFNGIEVTPFYVRKEVQTLDRLFLCHNNFRRWGDRAGLELSEGLTTLRNLAPSSWRKPRLPDGFGDGAFIGPVDELRLDSHPHGWECWQIKALARCQTELEFDLPDGQLVASLKANSTDVSDRNLREALKNARYVDGRETLSGLPVKEGGYVVTNIHIPRFPRPD
jgi:hypothetical protein